MTQNKLLKAKDLCVTFSQKSGLFNLKSTHLKAVDGVSFDLCKNEFLALVGESGSGKSTLGQAIAGLCPLTSGQLELFDQTLDLSDQNQWKSLRHQIQMIFQDFNGALNPRQTIEQILSAPLLTHQICTPQELPNRLKKILDQVMLPVDSLGRYPHQFSGGQRQRINLARALSVQPQILICDEMTSALDVSVQAQILELLHQNALENQISLIFITHDLAIAKSFCHNVGVMNHGKLAEYGSCAEVFSNPQHEYTKTLISAIPHL